MVMRTRSAITGTRIAVSTCPGSLSMMRLDLPKLKSRVTSVGWTFAPSGQRITCPDVAAICSSLTLRDSRLTSSGNSARESASTRSWSHERCDRRHAKMPARFERTARAKASQHRAKETTVAALVRPSISHTASFGRVFIVLLRWVNHGKWVGFFLSHDGLSEKTRLFAQWERRRARS